LGRTGRPQREADIKCEMVKGKSLAIQTTAEVRTSWVTNHDKRPKNSFPGDQAMKQKTNQVSRRANSQKDARGQDMGEKN